LKTNHLATLLLTAALSGPPKFLETGAQNNPLEFKEPLIMLLLIFNQLVTNLFFREIKFANKRYYVILSRVQVPTYVKGICTGRD
jgi:hypothetical protein